MRRRRKRRHLRGRGIMKEEGKEEEKGRQIKSRANYSNALQQGNEKLHLTARSTCVCSAAHMSVEITKRKRPCWYW